MFPATAFPKSGRRPKAESRINRASAEPTRNDHFNPRHSCALIAKLRRNGKYSGRKNIAPKGIAKSRNGLATTATTLADQRNKRPRRDRGVERVAFSAGRKSVPHSQ